MNKLYTFLQPQKSRSLIYTCLCILHLLFAFAGLAQAPSITVNAGKPPTGVTSCTGIAYGNGTYITIFYPNTVYKSSDGDHWSTVSSAAFAGATFNRIAWGAGQFVIVGTNGLIVTSPDGIVWTTRSSGTTNNFSDVQFIQDNFFAVGNNATVRSSADGITWNNITLNGGASTDMLMNITYGNGLYVIGARGSGGAIIYRSPTAASSSWTYQDAGPGSINKIQYLKDRFFIFTSGTTVYTSSNGSSWTNSTAAMPVTLPNAGTTTIGSPNQAFHGIYDGTKIFLFGSTQYYAGYGSIFSSTDGVNFTLQPRTVYIVCQGAAYINNRYFMYGNEGLVSSPDGVNYRYYNGSYTAVASSGSGNYAAVGMVGDAGVIFTSPDFSGWTEKTPLNTTQLYGVVWDGGRYVAAGSRIIIQSTDNGASWSQLATPDKYYNALAWGASKFIAAGYDGTTYNMELAYSANGSSWTTASTANNWYFKIKYINNRFFALGSSADSYTGVVMYSADGTSWSDITPALSFNTYYFNDIVYDGTKYHLQGADENYEFFSVSTATPLTTGSWANKGTITTAHPGTTLGGYYGEGAFAYYGGHFVGSVNDVNTYEAYTLYSSDGISWTAVPSGEYGVIGAVINEGSKFMMVGSGSLSVTADFSLVTLPVKLTEFTGSLVNNQSLLKWTTANEHNSSFFLVQRSTDQASWTTIGTVKAAGESSSALHYSFKDAQPSEGYNYYRLVQTDIDGKQQISNIVKIKIDRPGTLRLYPNPAATYVTLDLPGSGISSLVIYNAGGQAVYTNTFTGNQARLSLEALPKGVYRLLVCRDGRQYTAQFLHR